LISGGPCYTGDRLETLHSSVRFHTLQKRRRSSIVHCPASYLDGGSALR